ncbi:delta-60 repeat domain-containing protein [Pseudomonas sp. NPDC089396]|uniref:delta-60 repeat domain-containing protein n=1 Tax=Pseudomonas sp. NPDC089396 TaxID=3364461 RepID=UPI00383809F5
MPYRIDAKQAQGLIDPDFPAQIFAPEFAGVTTSVKTDKGRVYVGSAYTNGSTLETGYLLFRLTDDGVLDEQFGHLGSTVGTFQQGSQSFGYHIIQNNDGKFMVLGLTFSPIIPKKPALARFNEDGTLDTTFADNGHFVIEQPGRAQRRAFSAPIAMAMPSATPADSSQQAWQMAEAGGTFIVFGNYYNQDLVVMMFDWEANFVTSFNGTGYKHLERQGDGVVYGHSLFSDANSLSICATMRQPDLKDRDAFVVRLTREGEYDPCFGKGGIADFPGLPTLKNFLVLPEDERIIGCGADDDGSGLLVALHKSDGSLDQRFKRVPVKHEGNNVRWEHVLAVSPGSKGTKLIAVGEMRIRVGNLPAIVGRFDSDGELDSFATQTFALRRVTMAAGCEVDEQGRLLVHGQTQIPERSNGYVLRLLTNRNP